MPSSEPRWSGCRARCPPGPRPRRPGPTPGPWTGARSARPPRRRAAARSARVSPAISWPARLSRNSRAEPCGSRAENRAAASNSATHRVQVGVGGRAAAAARGAGLPARLRGQPGGVPHRPEHVVRACRLARGLSRPGPAARPPAAPRPRGAAPAQSRPRRAAGSPRPAARPVLRAGRPARRDQLARVGQRGGQRLVGRRLRPRPGRRRAAPGAAAAGRARRCRRAARSAARPRPPRSARPGRSAQSSRVSSGRVPGSAVSGSSSPATATGTPAAARARCSTGTWRVADRTSTAMDDQASPSIRCARRSVSAITAASWLALAAIDDPRRRPRSAAGQRDQVAVQCVPRVEAVVGRRGGQPGGDPARGGQQDRPAAAAGAQRDHPGRAPVRARGTGRGTG